MLSQTAFGNEFFCQRWLMARRDPFDELATSLFTPLPLAYVTGRRTVVAAAPLESVCGCRNDPPRSISTRYFPRSQKKKKNKYTSFSKPGVLHASTT